MSSHMMARGVGWLSIGVGLVALVVPPRIGGLVGYVETPALLRLVGVRDLYIGAGLLWPGHGRRWLWARAASDVLDATIIAANLLRGSTSRGRAMVGMTVSLSASLFALLLARQQAGRCAL
jgi:hypothetical protein